MGKSNADKAAEQRRLDNAVRHEYDDWQEVVVALAGLGVTEARLNGHGKQFVQAVTDWAHSKALLDRLT